ncbi:DUF397 domain-containing protein [Streptomyces sp. NPDC059828]|uniref:DUF397 domain-containing protein n=1 Tax=Streptomyces sp. NPDC059828 TaxID=3346965 RepID=UPI00364CD2D8
MTEHIIPDASTLSGWRKSSYSGNESGSCVEVLDGHPSGIPVRDSKNPHGAALVFQWASWGHFLGALKQGSV